VRAGEGTAEERASAVRSLCALISFSLR